MQNKKEINAGILIIGNKVLSGRTQDVNTSTLVVWLNSLGIPVSEVRVIPDDESIRVNADDFSVFYVVKKNDNNLGILLANGRGGGSGPGRPRPAE